PDLRAKERVILSIGRFFAGFHDKRHDVLIDAFAALHAGAGAADGWELHLVGGLGPEAGSAEHLERLRERAAGLPIVFHVDASAAELDDLLGRGALLWHATGYGVDPVAHPERLEHFGIATVEGMAHGAVPLVVPAGGQGEIVADGETGRHWGSVTELVDVTAELIAYRRERERLAAAAAAAAQRFGRARFEAAVRQEVLALATAPPRDG
ncbi:MAG: glycosyltransferase, partial [Solirubrobacteraceae bacterium]